MGVFEVIRALHYALIAVAFALIVQTLMPQLAGHRLSPGRLWYYAMIADSGLAMTTLALSTRQDSAERGVSLVMTLIWVGNAYLAHRKWVKYRDDDDDWPHLKAGRRLRSLLPASRRPLPTS